MSFESLLTEMLERRTTRVLALLSPATPPTAELPFPMSPAFREIYGQVLRVGVLPLILNRRQTQVLEKQYDWEQEGAKQLAEILKVKANPIFDAWDASWDSLWGTYDPNRAAASAAAARAANGHRKPNGGSGGLLQSVTGLFRKGKANGAGKPKGNAGAAGRPAGKPNGRADGKAGPRPGAVAPGPAEGSADANGNGAKQPMAGVRDMVGEHARQNGYLPPRNEDVDLLKDLVRVSPKSLEDAWKELTQIHTQEFKPANPKERARPGALLEAITRWQYSLPQRLGELLAVKAAADLEYCDAEFVRQYIRQSARSQEEGEKTLPYLALYQRSMPRVIR
jgi:hypothetical protein